MSLQIVKPALFVVLLSLCLQLPVMAGQKIQKCRDAKGAWHYGDFAAKACEATKVQRLDSSGVEISVDVGPTLAEKRQKKQRQQVLKRLRKQQFVQQKKDKQLLRLYDSEQAVIDMRDKRLQAIDQEIASNRSLSSAVAQARASLQKRLLNSKNNKEKQRLESFLTEYDQEIQAYRRVEQQTLRRRQTVRLKYTQDLAAFRDLLRRQAKRPGAAVQ
ncbi:MAG TPA: hypothetical protein ENI62_00710 [Gammaproteobacteria bacterium]|nr:hypothetical protein [Gammaproteobacteria bacterium]